MRQKDFDFWWLIVKIQRLCPAMQTSGKFERRALAGRKDHICLTEVASPRGLGCWPLIAVAGAGLCGRAFHSKVAAEEDWL